MLWVLSTAGWLVLRSVCTARQTPRFRSGTYRGTASRGRHIRDHSWESALRDVPDSPLSQLLSPLSGTDLQVFTSLPATLASQQTSDNSSRAEVDTEQPMKGMSHHDWAGKFKVGMQIFPDSMCRMRASSSLFMPLHFLAGVPEMWNCWME